jgi:sterol desaturase/sphingolipid hydroxylase (fatty acid hydroxylase superfamily)
MILIVSSLSPPSSSSEAGEYYSGLQWFAWLRRKQELHFVHHRHADSNFAVIDFFWDRILGTYRKPDSSM